MAKICVLKNPIQEYGWGSKTFIPQLMGGPVPSNRPQAELWMGAPPKTPSQVLWNGQWISLAELIQRHPEGILGKAVAKKFSNRLPFLFKVLAAGKPLSIQAHPNRDQAKEGFARENELQIPLDAPHRIYRDDNHKPEMICALGPFWVLNGFRKIEHIIRLLDKIASPLLNDLLSELKKHPDRAGLKRFFTALMTAQKSDQRQIVDAALNHSEEQAHADPTFQWVVKLGEDHPNDIGVLSPILMNLVHLKPGEAIYTPVGHVHAYLEGAGIELMANSDNVLRGGLTSKKMDIPELLRVMNFTHDRIDILSPERPKGGESTYASAAEEFVLSLITVREGSIFESPKSRSVEIMICVEGNFTVTDLGDGGELSLAKGAAILIPAEVKQYRIEGEAVLYKAAVPL